MVLLVTFVLLYPYVVAVLDDGPGPARLATASLLSATLVGLALAATAALLLCDWRLTRDPLVGTAATIGVFVAVQDVPLTVLGLGAPGTGASTELADEVGHVLVSLVLAGYALRARRATVTAGSRPVTSGVLLGLVAFTVRLVVSRDASPTGIRWDLAVVTVMLVAAAVVVTSVRRLAMPPRTTAPVVAATLLLVAGASIAALGGGHRSQVAANVVCAIAAALLLVGAAEHLQQTMAAHLRRISALAVRTATSEAEVKRDREIAHEVRSTVAGITAAVNLLADGRVAREESPTLVRMVNDEVGRLNRLVSGDTAPQATTVPVDEVLAPLVTAQQAMGHDVDCPPQGVLAVGCRDSLASVLDIVLTNAACHGGARTTVDSTVADGTVLLRVRDYGPGIDEDDARTLFQWGRPGPGSDGAGIGLHLARRLMREQGGELELEPTTGPGTTFLLSLPAATRQ